ncbi:hypothetical protein BKA67DRAFT_533761 [Truncatella angustata]|uniref:Uncharacterized protein n=1 Tax=Truncatella angustata TaxID=152316 RepID=A0A9P8UUM7_9PEZI|nr:uncharacterized protein BKA67DRAFT_533761 [Truncatella angustata]KAH6658631.1 hypothetical protein BKA67DRAFT_533761 [Truncatella angustata]
MTETSPTTVRREFARCVVQAASLVDPIFDHNIAFSATIAEWRLHHHAWQLADGTAEDHCFISVLRDVLVQAGGRSDAWHGTWFHDDQITTAMRLACLRSLLGWHGEFQGVELDTVQRLWFLQSFSAFENTRTTSVDDVKRQDKNLRKLLTSTEIDLPVIVLLDQPWSSYVKFKFFIIVEYRTGRFPPFGRMLISLARVSKLPDCVTKIIHAICDLTDLQTTQCDRELDDYWRKYLSLSKALHLCRDLPSDSNQVQYCCDHFRFRVQRWCPSYGRTHKVRRIMQ